MVHGGGGGGGASASLDEGRHVGLRLLEAPAARLNTATQLEGWHDDLRAVLGGADVGTAGDHDGGVATDMNTAARERLLRRLDGRSFMVTSATAELERQCEPSPTVTSGDAGQVSLGERTPLLPTPASVHCHEGSMLPASDQ